MFIDSSYFKGIINIPTNLDGVSEQLTDYIDRLEKKYLILALGQSLYYEFIAGLSEPSIDQKWLDLRDGKIYQFTDLNGLTRTIKWTGLKNSDKISFLAYFIYAEFVQDNFETFNTSFTKNIGENNNISDPSQRILKAHRLGIELYGTLPIGNFEYNLTNLGIGTYAYFYPVQVSNQVGLENQNNLFNFIYRANEADNATYTNWLFTAIYKPNFLGF